MASPAIATLGVISFIGAWNSFLWPYIMINTTDMRTITVALRAFQTDYGTEWGLMMAGSLIAVVPMLIIFLSAQRYFVRRIATTGFGGR